MFGHEYINGERKAISDMPKTVTRITTQWLGSVPNVNIRCKSPVQHSLCLKGDTVCLLGDSGYGLTLWLFTPFAIV